MINEAESAYEAMINARQRVATAGLAHLAMLKAASAAHGIGDVAISDSVMKIIAAETDAYTASEAGIRTVMNAKKWFAVHADEERFANELEEAYTEYAKELESSVNSVNQAIDNMHKEVEKKQKASQEP